MKRFKTIICVLCVVALIRPFSAVGSAYDSAYNNDINNLRCVTKVEDQGNRDACLTYALASTAGSFYCKAYNNGNSINTAVFSGAALADSAGDSTNFGTVLYSSVRHNLGNNCYITGIENLTGRGDRYLKQKIKENGAVFVAIPLPENVFENEALYNEKTASLNCSYKEEKDKVNVEKAADFKDNHAISIVGWDDSYDYRNYSDKSFAANGAWICKNSYGEDFGKNGYFYLSYNYTKHFHYAAAVEVTKYPEILSAETADGFWFSLFKTGAVGFKSSKNIGDAEIKITGKNKAEQTVRMDIVNGYNFIPLKNPIGYSGIKVAVDGREINQNSLIRYIIRPGKKLSAPAKPVEDKNWLTDFDELDIDLTGKTPSATSFNENDDSVNLKVTLRSVDNRFVVFPLDGYCFTEDTLVSIKMTQADKVDPVTYSGTVSELVNNPNLNFEFSGGKIIVKSKNTGGAVASGVRIELDECSKIKEVYLLEDNGSSRKLDKDSYSVSPEAIPDKGFYYASVVIEGFFAADVFSVIITRGDDGEEYYQADIAFDGDKISVGVMIEIPEVELATFINVIALFIAMLFGSFGR